MQRSTPFKNETDEVIASLLKRIETLEQKVSSLEENNYLAMQITAQEECAVNEIKTQTQIDVQELLSHVRLTLERNIFSRFTSIHEIDTPIAERMGYVDIKKQIYYVMPEAFKAEICKGLDSNFVAKTLRDAGVLSTSGKGFQKVIRVSRSGIRRVYAIDLGALEEPKTIEALHAA